MLYPVTEHVAKSARHTTFYLACGDQNAPLIVFVHGWPELSISWRHQLPVFASLGFRAIAPDMRGYGRSSVYTRHEDYAVEQSVTDMLELLQALGRERAVWVGHDWGSPVVWALASHHPERCEGVANLCVPYLPNGFTPSSAIKLVNREIYPEEQFPAGQWDYQLFYEESFENASAAFEADVEATVRAMFLRGDPSSVGTASRLSCIRRDGGWFGGLGRAPDVPLDTSVLTEADYRAYAAALKRNGFFGPDSWYMNAARNETYAGKARDAGRLTMPVLFLHAKYDGVCETMLSSLAEPMRTSCTNLTEAVVPSGHWMAQEQPVAVNRALTKFIADKMPAVFA